MKEYLCREIETSMIETNTMIDDLGAKGWELVCSYGWHNRYLIFVKDKKVCGACKK